MYLTTEAMQEIDYDYAQAIALDGRDDTERRVSEDDYLGADRESVTECLHGLHSLDFSIHFGSGALTWFCEDCPRDLLDTIALLDGQGF